MKRISRAAVVCTAAVAIGAPTAAYALTAPGHAPAGGSAKASPPHVLVVKPGQKVKAPDGRRVWLARNSALCQVGSMKVTTTTSSARGGAPVSASRTVPASECTGSPQAPSPRVEWTRSEVTRGHEMFVSGDYVSGRAPAGVRVRLDDGRWHEGTVLTLAGHPGRGAWLADLGRAPEQVRRTTVVVYDRAGQPVAPQRPASATGAKVD